MEKQKEIICPITFVGDHNESNSDLNGIFTDPYLSTVTINAKNISLFDNIKHLKDENPHVEIMAHKIDGQQLLASQSAVNGYILMNCRSLITTTIYRFLSEAFSGIEQVGLNPVNNYYLTHLYKRITIDDINIDNILIDSINNVVKISVGYQYQPNVEIRMITESMMNFIFNDTVSRILTPFSERLINISYIDDLFIAFTTKVYGKAPDKENTLNDKYVFVSSILNDIWRMIVGDLYLGYMMMAGTVANMIECNPKYFDYICFDDPNYSAADAFDNKLLESMKDKFVQLGKEYKDDMINEYRVTRTNKLPQREEENIGNGDLKIFKF